MNRFVFSLYDRNLKSSSNHARIQIKIVSVQTDRLSNIPFFSCILTERFSKKKNMIVSFYVDHIKITMARHLH